MLNVLDVIVILFLLWKGWKGMKNGLILELGSVIILYISFFISISNNIITNLSNQILTTLNLSEDLNWLFSFVFLYIILFLVLKLITNAIDSLSLGFINQFLGAVFGIIKWWLIFNIIIFILIFFNEKAIKHTDFNVFEKEILSKSLCVKMMCDTVKKYKKKDYPLIF